METKKITIRLKGDEYQFVVGMHLERELLEAVAAQGQRRVAVIADETTGALWGAATVATLQKGGHDATLLTFPGGEARKDERAVSELQHALLARQFGRDTLIIALGGGIVGDVAGYVAATYLRGVPYIQMPTTVLAMVDSSVGGKVGVDTPYGKNTIGAFHQPRAVIADLQFLSKLDKEHVLAGLLEAVKKFITSDKGTLALVDALDADEPLKTADTLQEVILRSVQGKADVVMRDEKESGERQILNFGHTIGHALELVSHYSLPHGMAVGYGMLVETQIATLLGILPEGERAEVESYLARFGITREKLKDFNVKEVLAATRGDKKARGSVPHYVLLEKIGSVHRVGDTWTQPVEDARVKEAFAALNPSDGAQRLWPAK